MSTRLLLTILILFSGAFLMKRDPAVRGIRNNNPGNIRGASFTWQGEVGRDDKDFVVFSSPLYGLRALGRVLRNYDRLYGINTVEGIINRWAPPIGDDGEPENDTRSYIEHAASALGLSASEPVPAADYPRLMAVIVKHENGQQPYSDSLILSGWEASA